MLDPLWLDEELMDEYVSACTARWQSLRQDIIDRDGTCVVTTGPSNSCQACHIIPHSGVSEYPPGSLQAHRHIAPSFWGVILQSLVEFTPWFLITMRWMPTM